jgi:hypothetical protein
MTGARTRYELRVGTVVSDAALATFRVPVRRTDVRRQTVYRFRVPTDRDLSELLHRLTERDVQVLEIRRCPESRRRDQGMAGAQEQGIQEQPAQHDVADTTETSRGVVLPFRRGTERRRGRSAG